MWPFDKPLPPGTPAPDFTLADQDNKPITLSALRGSNVALIFYPADETPGCRKQLCEFRDYWSQARERNTLVFGVNPGSAASHSDFRSRRQLPFPLLVDAGRKVASLYKSGGPVVRRTVYLVGPDGVIRYAKRGSPEPAQVLAEAVVRTSTSSEA